MRTEVIRAVEQFLYREARLLDEWRLHGWVELFTEDVRYWMPVYSNRYPAVSKAIGTIDQRLSSEVGPAQEEALAILDATMTIRYPARPHRASGYWHGVGRRAAFKDPPYD